MWEHFNNCWVFILVLIVAVKAHDAKDFDDTVLYKIDFELPDLDSFLEVKYEYRSFFTHDHEWYDCVLPMVEENKEELKTDEPEISPLALLQQLFTSCSFRIEAYWSYEICHGRNVRQYHEEREGKTTKFQEYYLGQWSEEKTQKMLKTWEAEHKAGITYKTLKIENTKYPYFEMEMSDGTICDITKGPRTTMVRYICYPHRKNEVYSFKETWSCNYEAIVLTSVLCMIPAFRPEESKEVSIKCFNLQKPVRKPLSMLRQELDDLDFSNADLPVSKLLGAAVKRIGSSADSYIFLDKVSDNVEKLAIELMTGNAPSVTAEGESAAVTNNLVAEDASSSESAASKTVNTPLINSSLLKNFISGKTCLMGGTSWWRYEFCYGRYVRQFHVSKTGEEELFLGYFNAAAHRQWLSNNPEKSLKQQELETNKYLWHHYEKGTICDRTDKPREVDVKLRCVKNTLSPVPVSMYLLEPKVCQYIFVVESPIVCDLLEFVDEYGLVDESKLILHEALFTTTELNMVLHDKKKDEQDQMDGIAAKGDAHQQQMAVDETPILEHEART